MNVITDVFVGLAASPFLVHHLCVVFSVTVLSAQFSSYSTISLVVYPREILTILFLSTEVIHLVKKGTTSSLFKGLENESNSVALKGSSISRQTPSTISCCSLHSRELIHVKLVHRIFRLANKMVSIQRHVH